MPFTSGSSGPTTTISIFFSRQNFPMEEKSFTEREIFVPQDAVPGFPGAINNSPHNLLWRIFHAIACSRPPEPRSKMLSISENRKSIKVNYLQQGQKKREEFFSSLH